MTTRANTRSTAPTSISAPPLPAELEDLLRRLRLPHIRSHAPEAVATAKAQRWEPAEVLKALFAEEVAGRERSALATRRATAGFPTGKTFDAWHPEASSIPAPTQQALRTLEWVHRRENLVVCGPSGTGKTFLLEALGQQAVEAGLKVAWFTLEDLGVLLRRHRADDTVSKAIARVLRADLVVVDDIGLLPVAADAAEGLYRLVDAAYEKRSVAISSNLHPSNGAQCSPSPGSSRSSTASPSTPTSSTPAPSPTGYARARTPAVRPTNPRVGPTFTPSGGAEDLDETQELDLDAPVAQYWPEFAGGGKQDLKVRWLLTHQAGLQHVEADLTLDDLRAVNPVLRKLEAQKLLSEPGTHVAYHAVTFGHLVGELVPADHRPHSRQVHR